MVLITKKADSITMVDTQQGRGCMCVRERQTDREKASVDSKKDMEQKNMHLGVSSLFSVAFRKLS